MSRFISTLLAKEKAVLESTLERLEEASGYADVDVRLTSEIVIESKKKMKQLGLDPADTTAPELYNALLNLTALHDSFLAKKLGVKDSSDASEVLGKVGEVTSKIANKRTIWSLKHSVAKRLLKESPPKQLMKQLGYRSVESMLKRESVDELIAGVKISENEDWLKAFYNSFSKVTPSDFESRKMIVKHPSGKKWSNLSRDYVNSHKSNVVDLKELGSVVILPLTVEKLGGITIAALTKVLYSLNELKLYSGYLKFVQVQHDFGQLVSDSLVDEPISHANLAGQDLNWRVLQNHLSQISTDNTSDVFEPHLQVEDLVLEAVEETLYKLEPALHFWFGTGSLGLPYDGYSVSFNIIDMATNYINHLSLEKSSTFYLQESLWGEILRRYLLEEPMQDQVALQLDNLLSDDDYTNEKIGGVALA